MTTLYGSHFEELSQRALNCLRVEGIMDLISLKASTPERIKSLPNLGPRTFNEIVDLLSHHGVEWERWEAVSSSHSTYTEGKRMLTAHVSSEVGEAVERISKKRGVTKVELFTAVLAQADLDEVALEIRRNRLVKEKEGLEARLARLSQELGE